jgi:hypothetical protein
MKRAGIFGLAILILGALFTFAFPAWLLTRAEASLRAACATCSLRTGLSYLLPLPLRLHVNGVEFTTGKADRLRVEVKVERVAVELRPDLLWRETKVIPSVTLYRPEIILDEGDLPKPPGQDSPLPPLQVLAAEIMDGTFTYRRRSEGYRAKVPLDQIEARLLTPLYLGDGPADHKVEAELSARLAESGKVKLSLAVQPYGPSLDLRLALDVKNQELARLNSYFDVHEGIALAGTLVNGQARVHLEGRYLHAAVLALYRDFDVRFRQTKEMSELEAFFANLLRHVRMDEGNLEEPRWEQRRAVHLVRHPEESIVSYLLRGMKEASLKVATD